MTIAVTAVWALRPKSTECVTNIIGRANLLSASAVLAGTLCHLVASAAQGWRKAPRLVALAVMVIYDVNFWNEATPFLISAWDWARSTL